MGENLILKDGYATITERGRLFAEDSNNENCIRVYCCQHPNIFKFQIRTFKPITDSIRKGKARNMIATVDLSIEDMEKILQYMKEEKNR